MFFYRCIKNALTAPPLKWNQFFRTPWATNVEVAFYFLLQTQQKRKDTRNCPEKAMKISHFNPNQSAPSIYIMIELCYFSLDQ